MEAVKLKAKRRSRRKIGVRKRIFGTAECPRVTVSRSLKNIYAQLIDDETGHTLCAVGTMSKSKVLRKKLKNGGNKEAATHVGYALAQKAKRKKITRVCFDRNGYRYHGRVLALAEALREKGLQF